MMQYADSARRVTATTEGKARYRTYGAIRDALDAGFVEKLQLAIVVASAICEGDDSRQVIHPSLWDRLEIDYDMDWVDGCGRHYEAAEFFVPTAIPLNVFDVPVWLRQLSSSQPANACSTPPLRTLWHDPRYKHVKLNGEEFHLGDQQAKVIQFLDRKFGEGDPWQHIKAIRGETKTGRPHDLFGKPKHWSHLLKSDGRGSYRLRNEED